MARHRIRNLLRRALRLDRLDRLEAMVAETHRVMLDVNHFAATTHHDLHGTRTQIAELRGELDALRNQSSHHENVTQAWIARRLIDAEIALAAIARQAAWFDAPPPRHVGPLVTVVVLTYLRASTVTSALRSVQLQTYDAWECLIVDDGGLDAETEQAVAPFLADERFRFIQIPHGGIPAARNHALGQARGEVIAHLDSDNSWHPTHLARIVRALDEQPLAEWVVTGQLILGGDGRAPRVRDEPISLDALIDANHCDINSMAHRRTVVDAIGGFDESLTRLSDWDFALRLAARSEPARVDAVTSVYRTDRSDRMNRTVPGNHFAHRIRERHRGLPASGLRVLLAEWHHPHNAEPSVAMATALGRLGAEVEVWSDADLTVSYESNLPVHRGELEATIAEREPDLVITHWSLEHTRDRPITRPAGVPHVVRVHGSEWDPDAVSALLDDGAVVHTFPHLVDPAWSAHRNLIVAPTFFDDARYQPVAEKDDRLVVRTTAGLLTEDLDTFLLAADRCPDHRFVLVIGTAVQPRSITETLLARRDELASRAEIASDLQHDEVSELVRNAGIYLHTHATSHPVTMPVSLAEAMATGCWVLGPDLPGMGDYIGRGGRLYAGASPEERADAASSLIRASAGWSAETWRDQRAESVDHAFQHYAGIDVVDRLLRSWRERFRLPPRVDR